MTQWVKPLNVMPASHIRALIQIPAALLPQQLPAYAPGNEAGHGLSGWAPARLEFLDVGCRLAQTGC